MDPRTEVLLTVLALSQEPSRPMRDAMRSVMPKRLTAAFRKAVRDGLIERDRHVGVYLSEEGCAVLDAAKLGSRPFYMGEGR